MDNQSFFKLKTTPSGKRLWTYMAAILEATDMINGASFPINKFLRNFSTHLEAQRIVRVPGGYKLSSQGQNYFNDRYNAGSPQHIERDEVLQLVQCIKEGNGTGEWIPL